MPNEVSLCMIVKNEEQNIRRCLESVKDIVDEIIIVDTGSTDNTVEICKSYGAQVYHFEWCNDFSAARNESLKYPTKDWILIMDADDEFCVEDKDKFRKLLNTRLDENSVCFFETLNYFGSTADSNNISVNLNPRLFKNNHGFHYEGKVHNQLVNSKYKFTGTSYPIKIYHYGYLDKYVISQEKRKRNISLLEEQIRKEPDKKYAYFNLGNEYFAMNDKKKALEHYFKAYEDFNPITGYGSALIARIIISYFVLEQYKEALEFVDTGVQYYPKFTDLFFLKGLIYKHQNKPLLAIKALQKCIEMGEPPAEQKFLYGTADFRPYYELGNIYTKFYDYDTAYKLCIETIRLRPDYLAPLYNIAHILKEKKTHTEEFKKTIEGFFTDFPKAYPIIADIFFTEGYYETALEYIEKYECAGLYSENLMILKVKCLVRTARFDECIKINIIPNNKIFHLQLSMYKVISLVMTDKYDLALDTIIKFDATNLTETDKKMLPVYRQLVNLFANKPTSILSQDENERFYTSFIFEICEILLVNKEYDKLEKALNLFNFISDKTVLLQLGKLYYRHGYIDMAKKEIIRSIKLFDVMDAEALDILRMDAE